MTMATDKKRTPYLQQTHIHKHVLHPNLTINIHNHMGFILVKQFPHCHHFTEDFFHQMITNSIQRQQPRQQLSFI